MYSFFGEHQFRLHDHLRLISSARVDIHSRIKPMFSPRIGLIYTPTLQDTVKLVASRSVRRTSDFFSQSEYLNTRKKSRHVETLNNVELSYKRIFSDSLNASVHAVYSELDIIAFFSADTESLSTNAPLGKMKFGNLEFELTYTKDNSRFSISHTITELFDFNLERDFPGVQFISTSPFGFGNDLASWSNHTTKLVWNHKINQSFSFNLSGFAYWGYEGAKDWAEYNREVLPPLREENTTFFEDNDKAFASSVFVHASVLYNLNKHSQLMLTGHNLLGLIDRDLNKRNISTRLGTYVLETPALSITLRAKF